MANLESQRNTKSRLSLYQVPELPEEIIQHIFTFLEAEKDRIRASCLSKSWLNAWQTRPILHFNENRFYWQDLGVYYSDRDEFLNYVNSCLQRYRDEKISIEKLKLEIETSIADEWIHVAILNGVKELEIHQSHEYSNLPGIIFEAQSLINLFINGSSARLKLPKNTNCHNLKSLHLCYVSLDELVLESIISSCQKIEYLKLDSCTINGKMNVIKSPNLKEFWYSPYPRADDAYNIVEIEAPNLEILEFQVYFCRISLSTCRNLKRLVLNYVGEIPDGFFSDFENKFPNLEHLEISHLGFNLPRIRISNSSIRKIELNILRSNYLEELYIDAPNCIHF